MQLHKGLEIILPNKVTQPSKHEKESTNMPALKKYQQVQYTLVGLNIDSQQLTTNHRHCWNGQWNLEGAIKEFWVLLRSV